MTNTGKTKATSKNRSPTRSPSAFSKSDAEPAPRFSYTAEQVDAIRSIRSLHDDADRAWIRVEVGEANPITGKVAKTVKPHWKPIPKSAIEEGYSHWAYMTALGYKDFEDHVSKPNSVFGIIPFMFGLAAVDIDHSDPEYLLMVQDIVGTPLASYSTPSGGLHAIYPIRDMEVATKIPATTFKIGGESIGEVCCLHRFANCWEPISWLRAARERMDMDDDDPMVRWLSPDSLSFVEPPVRKPRKPRDPNAPPVDFGITIDDIVAHYGMEENNSGEYQGHCPICDASRSGTGTRFKATPADGKGGFLLNCFGCSPNGFGTDEFFRIINPVKHGGSNQ